MGRLRLLRLTLLLRLRLRLLLDGLRQRDIMGQACAAASCQPQVWLRGASASSGCCPSWLCLLLLGVGLQQDNMRHAHTAEPC